MSVPYCAVIWLSADVFELNKHGECSGTSVHKVERFPITLRGDSEFDAVAKLKSVLSCFRANCESLKAPDPLADFIERQNRCPSKTADTSS